MFCQRRKGQPFSAMLCIACQAMDHQIAFVFDPASGHLLGRGAVAKANCFRL
jgi:hypothetical protein